MGDTQQLLVPRRAMVGKRNSVEARSASDVASKHCTGVSPLISAPHTFASLNN